MKNRNILIVIGIVFGLCAVFSSIMAICGYFAPDAVLTNSEAPVQTATPTASPTPPPTSGAEAIALPELIEETPEPEPSPTPYVSPVDFDKLQSVNPDIYAWLEIEGSDISYPIVQSPDDDSYYLTHNSDREESASGAVFSEVTYNSDDLSDPVTILYGHHMRSGAIFGNLQQYFSDGSFFSENPVIKIYTPNEVLEYRVFAAVPYGNEHLLYYFDFSDEEVFESFFSAVFNIRDLSAQFNEAYAPGTGDKVLILSTCLQRNVDRRYLVMATLISQ